MQHGTLSQRGFAHRTSRRPWTPWPARRGGRLIYGSAIRNEIKHLKTNDLTISNLRYSPVRESENGWSQSDSQSPLPPCRSLSAVAGGRPWTPGRLIYGAAIRIEIKHLKTNDVRISNLLYSPVLERRNKSHTPLITSHSPLATAFRYSASPMLDLSICARAPGCD